MSDAPTTHAHRRLARQGRDVPTTHADVPTTHFGLIKPQDGGSVGTWGPKLNQNFDIIDANLYSSTPIGAVIMFGGATPPVGWLICDGSSLSTTTYAALFAAIGYAHGGSGANFNLPNISSRFPLGANPSNPIGQVAGTYSYTIGVGNLPPHAHSITDVAHGHGVNQWAHAHGISTGGHSHTISTGGHDHGPSLLKFVGAGGTQGVGFSPNNVVTGRTDAVGNLGGNTDFAGNLGGGTDVQSSAISIQLSGTGLSTTNNAGSGVPMSIVPMYVALHFLMKYQ